MNINKVNSAPSTEFSTLPESDVWRERYVRDMKIIMSYLGKPVDGLKFTPSDILQAIIIGIVSRNAEILDLRKINKKIVKSSAVIAQTDLFL